jgi:AraC-like DNA-binding protein
MKLSRENVQPQAGSSFARLEFVLPEFDTHYHYHPEIEITWIVESEGQRLVGDCLERELFGNELWRLPEFDRIDRMLERSTRGLFFSSATSRLARGSMLKVFRAQEGPSSVIELLELLNILSSDERSVPIASAVYSQPVKTKKIDRLQRVLNFLESRWREPVTLTEAAEVAALHPQSMSRFFRKHLGVTFQAYVVQLRVRRAAQALLESDRKVVDIAFDCGFNNLANFNRSFHSAYGQTPSAYRKRAR